MDEAWEVAVRHLEKDFMKLSKKGKASVEVQEKVEV